jgi:hypothetical protein
LDQINKDVLADLKAKLSDFRANGRDPYEAVMTPALWEELKRLHRRGLNLGYQLTGPDVLGCRVRLRREARGVTLRFADGEEHFPALGS